MFRVVHWHQSETAEALRPIGTLLCREFVAAMGNAARKLGWHEVHARIRDCREGKLDIIRVHRRDDSWNARIGKAAKEGQSAISRHCVLIERWVDVAVNVYPSCIHSVASLEVVKATVIYARL